MPVVDEEEIITEDRLHDKGSGQDRLRLDPDHGRRLHSAVVQQDGTRAVSGRGQKGEAEDNRGELLIRKLHREKEG
jgi:hypothetical protein